MRKPHRRLALINNYTRSTEVSVMLITEMIFSGVYILFKTTIIYSIVGTYYVLFNIVPGANLIDCISTVLFV